MTTDPQDSRTAPALEDEQTGHDPVDLPSPQGKGLLIGLTPFVIWSAQHRENNLRFLESLDSNYYSYVAEANFSFIGTSKEFHAAKSMRMAYYQGAENLFALLWVLIQAPDNPLAYMLKYKHQVHQLVAHIGTENGIAVHGRGQVKLDWECTLALLKPSFDTARLPYDVLGSMTTFLKCLADDFLNPQIREEYNSMKHGMRIGSGGFRLALWHPSDEESPEIGESERLIWDSGESRFGSTFFTSEDIDKVNFAVRHNALNWSPENIWHGLSMVSMMISNLLNVLKSVQDGRQALLEFPAAEEGWRRPWMIKAAKVTATSYPEVLSINLGALPSKAQVIADALNHSLTEGGA